MHVCYPFSTVDVLANIWICPSAPSSSVSSRLLLHPRRQPPCRARSHLEFQPKTQIPCDFSDSSSHSSEETRVSRAFHCVYDCSLHSRVSSSSFCSESAERSVERCWNCSAAAESKPFLSCGACRSVQSVDRSVDYFQIFGQDMSYWAGLVHKELEIDENALPETGVSMPIRFSSKTDKEKADAAEQSARVIDAYHTLWKPLLRAMYLWFSALTAAEALTLYMRLEGELVDEEKTVLDPELLAEPFSTIDRLAGDLDLPLLLPPQPLPPHYSSISDDSFFCSLSLVLVCPKHPLWFLFLSATEEEQRERKKSSPLYCLNISSAILIECQSFEETRSKKKRSTIRTTRGRSSEPHVRSSDPTQRSPRSTKISVRSSHQFSGSQFWRQNMVRSSEPNVRSSEPITELSSLNPGNICAERFQTESGSLELTTCPLERPNPEKSSLDQNFSPLEPSVLWIAILETEHGPFERTHHRAQFARPKEYLC
ncbi:iron-sulfur cluster co-chaperone protein HscB, mitochondrial [Cinnamomum micranthum f. kanehirae]|uniref:Iron-sulfur cluster co-chaperone protein HscB, mitochondrial n=1 Tax=Cinnamomum micranthum f. kanehirae TaxID=337451 RepID=A0A443PN32_9MAGN|nr:iron-sulfur cluster co-chaperone protein HscB, mitochondrial [Cinnamomum micranthum f. kanehirae]